MRKSVVSIRFERTRRLHRVLESLAGFIAHIVVCDTCEAWRACLRHLPTRLRIRNLGTRLRQVPTRLRHLPTCLRQQRTRIISIRRNTCRPLNTPP